MSEFAVVITYKFKDEETQSIILDSVNDTDVNGSSVITTHPVVSGDEIADHMYKQPKTMRISGSCSLNGSNTIVVNGEGTKLANFEELFERIQTDGVQCDIYKVSIRNDKDIRFKRRSNMVLTSLSWKEKINGLDFTLNFSQVLLADVTEYDVDIDDEYAPNVTEPATLSFTNTLIDWTQIDAAICEILSKEELWTTEFKNFISSAGQTTLASILVGAAAVVIISVVAALNTTPVGWVITAIGLAVASAVIFVKGLVDAFKKAKSKRKYAIEQFTYYKNSKKNEQEAQRFADFIYSIHQQFESINSLVHVYQVASDEPQECMLTINDEYYIFTFTKNNTSGKYSLHVSDVEEKNTKDFTDVTAAPTDFTQLTSSNFLIKTTNNSRVYLMCTADDKSVLSNYYIVVCDFNPDDFNNLIYDIITANIYKNA